MDDLLTLWPLLLFWPTPVVASSAVAQPGTTQKLHTQPDLTEAIDQRVLNRTGFVRGLVT